MSQEGTPTNLSLWFWQPVYHILHEENSIFNKTILNMISEIQEAAFPV